jgi:hypothetical protein
MFKILKFFFNLIYLVANNGSGREREGQLGGKMEIVGEKMTNLFFRTLGFHFKTLFFLFFIPGKTFGRTISNHESLGILFK